MFRKVYRVLPVLAVAVVSLSFLLFAGLWLGFRLGNSGGSEVQIGPLVKQIQDLEVLHTVRYSMKDIFEHENYLKPSGLGGRSAGADIASRAFTTNRVTVIANGHVEAGVDLEQIGPEDVQVVQTEQGAIYRVRLPRAVLYEPNVNTRVTDLRRGVFYNDINIVPRAQREAARRFRESALRDDILRTAESNAVQTLSKLVSLNGGARVEFHFDRVVARR